MAITTTTKNDDAKSAKTNTTRSKNSKKNLCQTVTKSLRTCCVCCIHIPEVIEVIHSSRILPPVLGDIVAAFLTAPTQPIGYVSLHPPTRRRYHVVCVPCHEDLTNTTLTIHGTEFITCPAKGCNVEVGVCHAYKNHVNDPLPSR